MAEVTTEAGVAARAQAQPPLTCTLRPKEVTGRQGPVLNMGEVALANHSDAPVEIDYTMTPLQFLGLAVIGPDAGTVSEGRFSGRFSPSREPAVLRLQPGEKFTAKVALLATVPRDRRVPRKYTVQASYRFQSRRVMAEPLTVEVTG